MIKLKIQNSTNSGKTWQHLSSLTEILWQYYSASLIFLTFLTEHIYFKKIKISIISPSSSLRSTGNSTDSASEARDVRLDEAPEAKLAGLLPGNLLIQWSHKEELVEPVRETSI